MRLLNTTTLRLEEFIHIGNFYSPGLKYAILSHTWEQEEVKFSDIADLSHTRKLAGLSKVDFYAQDWSLLGKKSDRPFLSVLSEATNIEQAVLSGKTHISSACVARKMFWASKRETTRPEDEAYCLMGLFAVNMPLIYGEDTTSSHQDPHVLPFSGDLLAYSYSPHDRHRRHCWGNGMILSGSTLELPALMFDHMAGDGEGSQQCGIQHLGAGPELSKRFLDSGESWETTIVVLDCQLGPIPGTSPLLILVPNDANFSSDISDPEDLYPRDILTSQS
ncbi:hypothetical protein B0H66DRAFT_606899 [Apodospora peruviana]|uniref:Uncharacterized protein n=1 Tax=Apodospora peruviana TaxID=516989 RepID=A0AAE0HX70_9PEZI|nr:hypothetical protein B0H66DRAFT_606899 [Apodospora peruviana]